MPYEQDGLASLSLAIAAIVVLFAAAIWALRRLRPGTGMWGGARDCTILRSMPLGPRERLVVVRVGPRHLVLGISAAAISLLCELDEPLAPITPANEKFGQALRNAVAQRWHGD